MKSIFLKILAIWGVISLFLIMPVIQAVRKNNIECEPNIQFSLTPLYYTSWNSTNSTPLPPNTAAEIAISHTKKVYLDNEGWRWSPTAFFLSTHSSNEWSYTIKLIGTDENNDSDFPASPIETFVRISMTGEIINNQ